MSPRALFFAIQHHAGVVFKDCDGDVSHVAAKDFESFATRVKLVSAAVRRTPKYDTHFYSFCSPLNLPLAALDHAVPEMRALVPLAVELLQRGPVERLYRAFSTSDRLVHVAEAYASGERYITAYGLAKASLGLATPFHAAAAAVHLTLMALSSRNGEAEEARAHYVAALRDAERHWGAYHPMLIVAHQEMASLYENADMLNEAVTCGELAFQIAMRAFGPQHECTVDQALEVARLYEQAEQFPAAAAAFDKGTNFDYVCFLLMYCSFDVHQGDGRRADKGGRRGALECGAVCPFRR